MQNRLFHKSLDLTNGFLPSVDPLIMLPDMSSDGEELTLNKALNKIIDNLPVLLKEKKLGSAVDALQQEYANQKIVLAHHHVAQKQAAIRTLSFIAQAYIFEHVNAKRNVVPSVIATTLYRLSYLKQSRPMLTYNEYALHNWRRLDPTKPITLDNIEPIATFTGTDDEKWFIKIHVAIEAACAKALNAAQLISRITSTNNVSEGNIKEASDICMQNDLQEMTKALQEAIGLMHKMKEGCQPSVFWAQMRPYLNGWNTVDAVATGKKGVLFAGINQDDSKGYQYYGPSGAQSSIVPAFDAILNVKHQIDSMFEHLDHFKAYMPEEHRAFIANLGLSKTRQYIKASDNEALRESYDEAVKALWQFRGAHMGLLHAYIYKPAAAEGVSRKEVKGTGGSPLDHYLSQRFKSTNEHQLSQLEMKAGM